LYAGIFKRQTATRVVFMKVFNNSEYTYSTRKAEDPQTFKKTNTNTKRQASDQNIKEAPTSNLINVNKHNK